LLTEAGLARMHVGPMLSNIIFHVLRTFEKARDGNAKGFRICDEIQAYPAFKTYFKFFENYDRLQLSSALVNSAVVDVKGAGEEPM